MLREELRVTKERLLAMSWEANARERKNVGEKGSGREEGRKVLRREGERRSAVQLAAVAVAAAQNGREAS